MNSLPDNDSSAPNPKAAGMTALTAWRWPLTLLALASMMIAAAFFFLHQAQTGLKTGLEEIVEKTESFAQGFRQGTITETFLASLPTIGDADGGLLELATLHSTEILRAEDNLRIWWNYVSLGTTVSEITVPVIYRYHIKLTDPWELSVSNRTCLVVAPRIRPSLPPGIDTGNIVKNSRNGWARFNADDQLTELEKSITEKLTEFADSPERVALIRELARKTVADFVHSWLLREDHWRDDRFNRVIVQFADEPKAPRLAQRNGLTLP